jgi:hypothetical protein
VEAADYRDRMLALSRSEGKRQAPLQAAMKRFVADIALSALEDGLIHTLRHVGLD